MNPDKREQAFILFRCDGTTDTGLGHVSRCLALAEGLGESGFSYRFLGRFDAGGAELLARANTIYEFSLGETGGEEDLAGTLKLISRGCAGVVIDSYFIDDSYIAAVGRERTPILLIDDFNRLQRYDCAGLLNFTVGAKQLNYPLGRVMYFLGPGYLLVRRRLRLLRRGARPRSGGVRRVLVAIGGVDALNLSCQVVGLLLRVASNVSVHVVVGRDYAYAKQLKSLMAGFHEGSVSTQLVDLADEFAWADLCVCGGGLTKYESAYMGVPTVVLSQNREQAKETVQFAGKGLAVDLGLGSEKADAELAADLSDLLVNKSLRESLSEAGLTCFPEDPTRRAAEAFARILRA